MRALELLVERRHLPAGAPILLGQPRRHHAHHVHDEQVERGDDPRVPQRRPRHRQPAERLRDDDREERGRRVRRGDDRRPAREHERRVDGNDDVHAQPLRGGEPPRVVDAGRHERDVDEHPHVGLQAEPPSRARDQVVGDVQEEREDRERAQRQVAARIGADPEHLVERQNQRGNNDTNRQLADDPRNAGGARGRARLGYSCHSPRSSSTRLKTSSASTTTGIPP